MYFTPNIFCINLLWIENDTNTYKQNLHEMSFNANFMTNELMNCDNKSKLNNVFHYSL